MSGCPTTSSVSRESVRSARVRTGTSRDESPPKDSHMKTSGGFSELLIVLLVSIIAYAIIGGLPMSVEKIIWYIGVAAIDIAYIVGQVRRHL